MWPYTEAQKTMMTPQRQRRTGPAPTKPPASKPAAPAPPIAQRAGRQQGGSGSFPSRSTTGTGNFRRPQIA